jgi:hypothetical protein
MIKKVYTILEITQEYPQRTCEYHWKTEKQIKKNYFLETTKNYQNLIKMITMKINGTISWHNSCYMFKKENCAQKQQVSIAWLGIGKLAEVIKINLGDQYNSLFLIILSNKGIVFTLYYEAHIVCKSKFHTCIILDVGEKALKQTSTCGDQRKSVLQQSPIFTICRIPFTIMFILFYC